LIEIQSLEIVGRRCQDTSDPFVLIDFLDQFLKISFSLSVESLRAYLLIWIIRQDDVGKVVMGKRLA
jgi:hypothetical protein